MHCYSSYYRSFILACVSLLQVQNSYESNRNHEAMRVKIFKFSTTIETFTPTQKKWKK